MSDQDQGGEIPAPRKAEDSRLFAFQHPVFAIKGSFFRMGADGSTPLYYVCLGETHAAVPAGQLTRSFDIPADGEDARLVKIAAEGLRYVHEIRPGDSIPSELLDGSASWTVTQRHVEAAQARFSMQLISWLTSKPMATLDGHAFADILEDPATKTRVQEAFAAIAERLGIGAERKQEVVDKVNELTREFSYIEALRSRCFRVRKIGANLKGLANAYRRERSFNEEIGRAQSLVSSPIKKLAGLCDQVDANTEDLLALLKKFGESVAYIRRMRDELHQHLMKWDELINAWKDATTERSPANERLIRQTYRFAARHFPQTSDW